MLQSLDEHCDQVPGVPPVGLGNHAHHQVISVSKDDGMFLTVILLSFHAGPHLQLRHQVQPWY